MFYGINTYGTFPKPCLKQELIYEAPAVKRNFGKDFYVSLNMQYAFNSFVPAPSLKYHYDSPKRPYK